MFLGFWNACNFFFFFGGGDFGVPHAPTRGSRGVRKRYTSSYDHDMWPVKILERSGLTVKSYHPETLAAEEEKKQRKKNWQNHKAFLAGMPYGFQPYDFQKVVSSKLSIISNCAWYNKSYMVFQFTSWHLTFALKGQIKVIWFSLGCVS